MTLAIANTTIISKMIDELEKAKIKKDDQKVMKRHIANVQLLCELILEDVDEDARPVSDSEVTAQEIKAMLGEKYSQQGKKISQKNQSSQSTDKYDQANSDSIFDF